MSRSTVRILRRASAVLFGSMLAGCTALAPLPPESTLKERLDRFPRRDLPIERPVTVYWNEHQVPYIVAETDADAAFTLGLVHAHLRLGQMALYRRIAAGRVAEMGGPLAIDIDHGVRLLGFGRAATATLQAMPAESRQWLDRFVEGINVYQARVRPLPHEYRVLDLDPEPWTAEDVLTFGRLAGTDVNWLVWASLLKLRERPDWPQIWARLVSGDSAAAAASTGTEGEPLSQLLASISRSGSNSLAIGPQYTAGGAAILANDPHLGLNLPNTWLIAGLKSPSYHVVGLMVPGLPVFGIGRNPQIAWGGTNMRASASDLIDVSGLPPEGIRETSATIGVRWWPDEAITLRETDWGPVLSDAPQLRDLHLGPVSLRWTGHDVSDEISAMLAVARAGDFAAFRAALGGFSLPGQNMLYADAAGHIGRVFAVHVPDRGGPPPVDVVVTPGDASLIWSRVRTADDFPAVLDPPEGFIASANNRPPDPHVSVGYFFSPDDRVRRMRQLLAESATVDVETVMQFQRDVYVDSSVALRDAIITQIGAAGIDAQLNEDERRFVGELAGWDGYYRRDSRGAVAFELMRFEFTANFYQSRFGASDWAAFAGVGRIKEMLVEDIAAADASQLAPMLRVSIGRATARFDDFAGWGDMHRLVLQHPLAFLPLVGSRYRFADEPAAGSTDSLMKTAHGLTNERHRTTYGANARHISDMSDPDSNLFVILGGQDGWLNSSTFLDQVPMWHEGAYIRMPLRLDTVQADFNHRMELQP
jgi:Protein related to penicillin acylase